MAVKKITVTHNGQVFTRATARTYSHIVVCKSNFDKDMASAIDTAEIMAKKNHAYFTREAGPGALYKFSPDVLARYKRIAAMTPADYCAGEVAEARAGIEKSKANGVYDRAGVYAWCGRLDLAQKQADAARKFGLLDVEIVAI